MEILNLGMVDLFTIFSRIYSPSSFRTISQGQLLKSSSARLTSPDREKKNWECMYFFTQNTIVKSY